MPVLRGAVDLKTHTMADQSWITCPSCQFEGFMPVLGREGAIQSWNTRALPVQKHDADTVERVAKALCEIYCPWSITGHEGRELYRTSARAALSAMPPKEVSVQEAARVLEDAWSLESVEGCQFRCLVTRAGHDGRISGLKFIAALRALSEKPQ